MPVVLTVFDLAIPTRVVHDAFNNVVDGGGAQRSLRRRDR